MKIPSSIKNSFAAIATFLTKKQPFCIIQSPLFQTYHWELKENAVILHN